MSVPIAIVAAVAKNGIIGARGVLPWRVKADLKKFRAITMGKPLIMGRKTYEGLPRVLDGRDLVVVTRQPEFNTTGAFISESFDAAVTLAQKLAAGRDAKEVLVGGGGEIYREAMPVAEKLYITEVAAEPEGDTSFPAISPDEWVEIWRKPLKRNVGDTVDAVRIVYARRR